MARTAFVVLSRRYSRENAPHQLPVYVKRSGPAWQALQRLRHAGVGHRLRVLDFPPELRVVTIVNSTLVQVRDTGVWDHSSLPALVKRIGRCRCGRSNELIKLFKLF